MKFCPKCFYILDIGKSSLGNVDQKYEEILTVNDLFKIEDDLSKYKAMFSKDDLYKNKKYIKLSKEEKDKYNIIFKDIINTGAEFKCNNCNYIEPIVETTLLYSFTKEDTYETINTLEENKLLCMDPLLPHTKDYTCKNPKCETHKNLSIKDSVFYKEKKSYRVKYICNTCYYSW